jgi:hypothetical protein
MNVMTMEHDGRRCKGIDFISTGLRAIPCNSGLRLIAEEQWTPWGDANQDALSQKIMGSYICNSGEQMVKQDSPWPKDCLGRPTLDW